jgi:hypothetical protein
LHWPPISGGGGGGYNTLDEKHRDRTLDYAFPGSIRIGNRISWPWDYLIFFHLLFLSQANQKFHNLH